MLYPIRVVTIRAITDNYCRSNMATAVALTGLHYLPKHHTNNVNIKPHVCKRLAIRAYITCALLAWWDRS